MKIFTDKRILSAGLIGGMLTRQSGNMHELANQSSVYTELGIPSEKILHLHQIHSDKIISISSNESAHAYATQPPADADGWLLSPLSTGWGAAILTADCVPLFLWNPQGTHAALVHCGWRGVVQGLAGKAARTLAQHTPAAQLNAWLGPHIQACCFEVQEDVAQQFPSDCVVRKKERLFVDLTAAITQQLLGAGLNAPHICAPYYCTCTDRENFFSWRRDHQKNLLLSFIYKP